MTNQDYMKLAIELAKKGTGNVNPNPMVGAVIVKNNKIIGTGYHEYYGGPHAERNALANCIESPVGATLYVTLEPCCHQGKTPPCAEAIIKSGIKKVVIGTLDKNPIVAGKGVEFLKNNQIDVEMSPLEKECNTLIKVFEKFILTHRPFVLMKYAMTMDGKIATHTKNSKWISSEESLNHVQQLRHELTAIMVGVNTVIEDNPLLTCRIENGKNPIRIICDTHLRTPLESHIVQTSNSIPTYIATSSEDLELKAQYELAGCHIIQVNKNGQHIDLKQLMTILGKMTIDSILLEGGGTLNWSALDQQIVDEVQAYIAPKIFGGIASTPIGGLGVALPSDAISLEPYSISKIGNDYVIKSEVIY